jgi:S1-C subfamily serine protease
MKPLLPPRILLLLIAIAVVGVMIYVQRHPPSEEDPLAEATKELARGVGLEVKPRPEGAQGGLLVTGVRPGTAAERLGFRAGDRVVAVGDRSVWHAIGLANGIGEALSRGMPISVLVNSDGHYHSIVMGRGLLGSRGGPARGRDR